MNKRTWKERLWLVRDPTELETVVRTYSRLFDEEDRRVLRLIRCDEWPAIYYGVRQELRSDYGLPCDMKAPCFDPTRRIYHPIRRILVPGTLMAAAKARRNPNKVVTL